MKRDGYLMQRILTLPNMMSAWRLASRGKHNRKEVQYFGLHAEESCQMLADQVAAGELDGLLEYSRFVVRDPKLRVIHAAPFPARVLHHAMINIAGPILERGAIAQSCACRTGRGNLYALEIARNWTKRRRFFLKMDVRKYFDSIHHGILMRRLSRVIKDKNLLELIWRIIESYETDPDRGLPIGTLTSQYFANFYLDALDRYIKESLRCRGYVRFMDDFILWDDDRDRLVSWQNEIENWLSEELYLQIKAGSGVGVCCQGIPFLGYRVKPGVLLLSKPSRRRFRRKLSELESLYSQGRISGAELRDRSSSLLAFTDQASCLPWRRGVIKSLNHKSELRY